jgi:hypothetical protein
LQEEIMKTIYLGIFVDADKIIEVCRDNGLPMLEKKISATHVTLSYMPASVDEKILGKTVKFKLTGYANDGTNAGFKVELTDAPQTVTDSIDDGKILHLTSSLSEKGYAKNTENLDFEPLAKPVELTGVVGAMQEDHVIKYCSNLAVYDISEISSKYVDYKDSQEVKKFYKNPDETYKRLNASRLRYIVPFYLDLNDRSYEEVCRATDEVEDYPYSFWGMKNTSCKGSWKRASLKHGEQDVYSYLVDEYSGVNGDISEKDGCYWHYEGAISYTSPFKLIFPQKDVEWGFSIVDMGLYIFRNGVGLIWYEVVMDEGTVRTSEDLITFQNSFKEIASRNVLIKSDKINISENVFDGCLHNIPLDIRMDGIIFNMGNWIVDRLAFLNAKYQASRSNKYPRRIAEKYAEKPVYSDNGKKPQYDREKTNIAEEKLKSYFPKECPDKAVMFTYVSFERQENWTKSQESLKVAYYLTNGYKSSYEVGDYTEKDAGHPFANVYWMASREGCGYYAWTSDYNRNFFTWTIYDKIIDDYFLLYIKVLYQSYSLMRFSQKLSSDELPCRYSDYLTLSEKTENLSEKISRIRAEISSFLVKSVVSSVSHINHQNEFYKYLLNRFGIKDDINSVTVGLSALNELQNETLERKREQDKLREQQEREKEQQREEDVRKREEEEASKLQNGLSYVAILTAISAATDGYALVVSLFSGELEGLKFAIFMVLFMVSVVLGAVSVVSVIKYKNFQRRLKKEKSLIESEKIDSNN